MAQQLSTRLQLDAFVSSGYKEAFNTAGSLLSDLKSQTSDLKKQLNTLGREADEIDKVGKSSDDVRSKMQLLERQIKETEKATEKFGEAKGHFRQASIGARALKSDIGKIADTAKVAALAIAGIGTAAALALSPDEELLAFDQTLQGIAFLAPEVDQAGIDAAKASILDLSNTYGTAAAEIATQHEQLTRNLGFEGARQTIAAAVEFQTVTGLSITEIEEELATARISLGIDTAPETQEFLNLLQGAHRAGIKIDNIDLGDLETLRKRVGEDVFGEAFQRELLTTIAFRQVDSFQFADYAQAFQEEIERAVLITPEMDAKAITKAQESIEALAKWGIRAEDGLLGAMRVYQQLSDAQQVQFVTELEPVLTAMPAEVIARGSEVLPEIQQQVDLILGSQVSMEDAANAVAESWSGAWGRIGTVAQNTRGILQEQFAATFGPILVENAQRFFDFVSAHRDQIQNFFTGVRDGITPIISRIWNAAREAYPDVKKFATEVWQELRSQFEAIAPVVRPFADAVWNIVKAIGGFVRDHPKLVATVITGIAAWKAYRLAADGVQVVGSLVSGFASVTGGHLHRLNAIVLENARLQGVMQTASRGVGTVFSGIGKAALGAIPGIGAMGGSLMAAIVPALPVILPIVGAVAAIGAAAFIVYKNWDPIRDFFVNNFETIRNALMIVFPGLGLLVGFAGVIRDNWSQITEFFKTIWETITLYAKIAWEGIQFIVLGTAVFIQRSWAKIKDFFGGIWTAIRGFFLDSPLAPIFEWMVGGIKKVVSPLLNFFSDFWGNISDMAGKVITWITDKFKWLNSVLNKVLGWLRKENEKLKEELNITASVEIPDTTAEVNQIVDASIEKPDTEIRTPIVNVETPEIPPIDMPKVEMPKRDIYNPNLKQERAKRQPRTVVSNAKELVSIGLGQLKELTKIANILQTGDIATPKVEKQATVVTPPEVKITQPIPETPSVTVKQSKTAVSRYTKDLVSIGLGQLKELHRHTKLLQGQTVETPKVEAPTVETPKVEAPTVEAAEVKTPKFEMPEIPKVSISQPKVRMPSLKNLESISLGILKGVTKAVNLLQTGDIATPKIVQRETTSVEVKTPEATLPDVKIEVPTVSPEIEAPIANLEMPELTLPDISIDAPVVAIKQPEITQPDVPQIDAPVVSIESPVVDIKQPEIVQPETPASVIEVTPASVFIQENVQPTLTETPEIDSPAVSVDAPIVNIAQPETPILEKTPQMPLQDVSVDAPVVNLSAPEINQPATEILTTVSPNEGIEIPPIAIESPVLNISGPDVEVETPALEVETPALVMDDPPVPSVAGGGGGDQTTIHETTSHQTNAPKVEVNNTFQIVATADTDTQELAEQIAAIIEQRINDATGTYLAT